MISRGRRIARIIIMACLLSMFPFLIDSDAIEFKSTAFPSGGKVPDRYTGTDEDLSPPVEWSGLPDGVVSLAVIMDDPDAPAGTWIHWVIYNIPPGSKGLAEGVPKLETLPGGARQGVNSWRMNGYAGPYPPEGPEHRYFFRIYALDSLIVPDIAMDKRELLARMKGHIIGTSEFAGTYGR